MLSGYDKGGCEEPSNVYLEAAQFVIPPSIKPLLLTSSRPKVMAKYYVATNWCQVQLYRSWLPNLMAGTTLRL
jgi:hypothetical protein